MGTPSVEGMGRALKPACSKRGSLKSACNVIDKLIQVGEDTMDPASAACYLKPEEKEGTFLVWMDVIYLVYFQSNMYFRIFVETRK